MLFDFSNPIGLSAGAGQEKLVDVIFPQLSSSNIRSLHCYGRQAYALSTMRTYLLRLPETIKTLSFNGSDNVAIACGLAALGRSIEALEIRNRSRLLDNDQITHPIEALQPLSELPQLTTLRLFNVASTLSELQDLFSGIGKNDKSYSSDPPSLTSTLTSLSAIQLFTHRTLPQSPTIPLAGGEFHDLIQVNNIASNLTYLWIEPGVLAKYEVHCIWKPSLVTKILQLCPKLHSFGYTSYISDDLPLHLPYGLRCLTLALCPPVHFMSNSYLQSCQRFLEFVQRVKGHGKVNLEGLELTILTSQQLRQNPGLWRLSFEEVDRMFRSGRAKLEAVCREENIILRFESM